MNLNRHLVQFLISLLLTISAGFYLFNSYAILNTRVNFISQTINLRQNLLKSTRRPELIQSEANQISQEISSFNFWISQGQELDLITVLEKIASQESVNQQIRLDLKDKKIASGGLEKIPIILTIKGSYNQLLNYLASLEELSQKIPIHNLKLTNQFSETSSQVQMVLIGEIYSQKK